MAEDQRAEKKMTKVEGGRSSAGRLKTVSWVLGAAALLCAAAVCLIINRTIYVPAENFAGRIAVIAAAYLLLVIIAARLRIKGQKDEAGARKVKRATAAVTAALAVICIIAAAVSSVTDKIQEDELRAAQLAAEDRGAETVYWTAFGKHYHFDEYCQSLPEAGTLYEGSMRDAFEAKRRQPCEFCAMPQEGTDQE